MEVKRVIKKHIGQYEGKKKKGGQRKGEMGKKLKFEKIKIIIIIKIYRRQKVCIR